MKYCPNCGAELTGETAAYCGECGSSLTDLGKGEQKRKKRTSRKPKNEREAPTPEPEETAPADGYDGYYDDVLPEDEGEIRRGPDRELVKKIVMLAAGLVLVIGICVAVLVLL